MFKITTSSAGNLVDVMSAFLNAGFAINKVSHSKGPPEDFSAEIGFTDAADLSKLTGELGKVEQDLSKAVADNSGT